LWAFTGEVKASNSTFAAVSLRVVGEGAQQHVERGARLWAFTGEVKASNSTFAAVSLRVVGEGVQQHVEHRDCLATT
jgi:hypothetical protein